MPEGRVANNQLATTDDDSRSQSSRKDFPICNLLMFCLILITIGTLMISLGMAIGLANRESDEDRCTSSCKEKRQLSERVSVGFKIAGPIILIMGLLLTVMACACCIASKKNDDAAKRGQIRLECNLPSISYGNTSVTTIHPVP